MEKIKHIEINNFKSIKHLEINGCNRINVFIGMPNAGKSNILEALSLIGLQHKFFNFDQLKNYVRFEHKNELYFEGNINSSFSVKANDNEVRVLLVNNTLIIRQSLNGETINSIDIEIKTNKNSLREIKKEFNQIKKYLFSTFKVKHRLNIFESDSSNLNYPFGENLGNIISNNSNVRNYVNELFLSNNLKLLIDKSSDELKIFKEFQDGTVFTLPYSMIADTLQRLIFYKASILSNENSVLLFEEPEAHCFEPYILEFTNSVKYDKNDNQFFIVTHSDFIIQEFLRDEESKNNTNIYLVNNVNGETKVKLLNKNKNEDVYELGMNPFFNFENLWENN